MLKKYEIETMIKNALLEMDGVFSDKPNEDGTYDLYFADVSEDDDNNIVLTFDTYVGNEKVETDIYKIKVEYGEGNKGCKTCTAGDGEFTVLLDKWGYEDFCPKCGRKLT